MRAVVYEKYGPPEVLRVVDVERPAPAEKEVLIRIHATTVTTTECIFRKGRPLLSRLFTGIARPRIKILGEEFSGVVEAVGKDVTRFEVGDEVFGEAGTTFGAYADYVSLPENGEFTSKPSGVSHEEAACCDGVLTALPFLRDKARLQAGQKILINGASGSIGTAAVQLAKHFGAVVTGVCSGANAELVKSLGADRVIDYTKEDFTATGEKYDVIFDTVGKTTFSRCRKALSDNGVFLEAAVGLSVLPAVVASSLFGRKKAVIAATGLRPPAEKIKDLDFLRELLEAAKFKAAIDRKYTLEQIVEAHRYVDTGHKKGNVILAVG
jgi:NADPH:quinone reductase-like Zn-dependent oxidoreductase